MPQQRADDPRSRVVTRRETGRCNRSLRIAFVRIALCTLPRLMACNFPAECDVLSSPFRVKLVEEAAK